MKGLLWVLPVFLLLAFSACGDSDATGGERSQQSGKGNTPKIAAPAGPRKKLVIRDLKVGSGPPARRGDLVKVYYVADQSETKEHLYHRWRPVEPLSYRIGYANWGLGWQKGIEGMRVGGRREVLIPARLALNGFPLDYIIEVIYLKQRDDRSGRGVTRS